MDSAQIENAVSELLRRAGVTFSAQLVGATKRDDWECDEWRVSIKSGRADYSEAFYTGVGHRADTAASRTAKAALKGTNRNSVAWKAAEALMAPQAPTAAAFFHSFVLDGSAIDQSFLDWCDEYGYSEDSRKALKTYEACCESGRKIRELFTPAQREELENLLQDY